ncbi:endonuclease domain-containing protein [Tsukamurella tyrosinosolvens]|uniref:endonuclease domain-containing protein n=1 Tax=Tsukamurella tyrosinosolvens TaxID=57704 RepID=UPI002DD4459F|nr:endonuclease domain-containing protein [Tsukamurella tyrosinosolvens]MEC4611825.1 endonuclease domain-containing protein [Tsukamurella tyrosinosolvens]
MARDREGKCDICTQVPESGKTGGGLVVEHDHTTGAIRGLTCGTCNHFVSGVEKALEVLELPALLDSLRRHLDRDLGPGVTEADRKRVRASLRERQGGRCAVCARPVERLYVDHDHDTGAIRGALCNACNIHLVAGVDRLGVQHVSVVATYLDVVVQPTL